MAKLINVKEIKEERGNLVVIEKLLPFEVKRVYFIYGLKKIPRGFHRHKTNRQALICIQGRCRIKNNNGNFEEDFILDSPKKCIILEPEDWHIMCDFEKDAILLVLASEYFDADDYIDEPY